MREFWAGESSLCHPCWRKGDFLLAQQQPSQWETAAVRPMRNHNRSELSLSSNRRSFQAAPPNCLLYKLTVPSSVPPLFQSKLILLVKSTSYFTFKVKSHHMEETHRFDVKWKKPDRKESVLWFHLDEAGETKLWWEKSDWRWPSGWWRRGTQGFLGVGVIWGWLQAVCTDTKVLWAVPLRFIYKLSFRTN